MLVVTGSRQNTEWIAVCCIWGCIAADQDHHIIMFGLISVVLHILHAMCTNAPWHKKKHEYELTFELSIVKSFTFLSVRPKTSVHSTHEVISTTKSWFYPLSMAGPRNIVFLFCPLHTWISLESWNLLMMKSTNWLLCKIIIWRICTCSSSRIG